MEFDFMFWAIKDILEQIKNYEKIIKNKPIYTNEFVLACGAKQALEWVILKLEAMKENDR